MLTTSGTAAANLHPAVLEADQSGVPLVVLTADRPPELRGTGANQTVDQIGLYGRAVRLFAEVGAPSEQPGQNAVLARPRRPSASPPRPGRDRLDPGPVHLNLALREPLVPDGDDGVAGAARRTRRRQSVDRPSTPGRRSRRRELPDDLPARTLVVVGDSPRAGAAAAPAWRESRGWPVLSRALAATPGTGPAALRVGHLLLADPALPERAPARAACSPSVGRPCTAASTALLHRADSGSTSSRRRTRWADQARRAAYVRCAAAARGHRRASRPGVARRLVRAPTRAAAAVVDAARRPTPPRSHASHGTSTRASRPVRSWSPGRRCRSATSVSRAAARGRDRPRQPRAPPGIDGTVSTAIGAALGWRSRHADGAAFALLGDLTFLHDANGLVLGPDEPRPQLALVVVDNDGGGIFGLLERADAPVAAPSNASSGRRTVSTSPHSAGRPARRTPG